MRVALVILIVVMAAVPAPLAAQEFGRNKVRYEDFGFSVLESENFRVHYPREIEPAARRSARLLERWTARFERLFDHSLSQRRPVILHDDHPDFQQTSAIPGLLPQGVGGVTEGRRARRALQADAAPWVLACSLRGAPCCRRTDVRADRAVCQETCRITLN